MTVGEMERYDRGLLLVVISDGAVWTTDTLPRLIHSVSSLQMEINVGWFSAFNKNIQTHYSLYYLTTALFKDTVCLGWSRLLLRNSEIWVCTVYFTWTLEILCSPLPKTIKQGKH